MTTTNIDYGGLELDRCEHRQGLLTLSGAATVKRGTILAVDSVSLKFVPFVKGGSSNQNGIPKAVLPYDLAGANGDNSISAITKGTLSKKRLVIHAQGDDSAIDAAVIDQLRDYGITPVEVDQVGGALYTDEDS